MAAAKSNGYKTYSTDVRRTMEPKHPPTVEAYLRETDRYKAFLVGYRPETLRPDKTQKLAGKIEDWERKWASSTHSTGETCVKTKL